MNAQITACGKKNPSSVPVLTPAIRTLGATPTMPIPFAAAAIVPAVCVPWPLWSIHADGVGSATPDSQEAELAKLTFGARSGCVKSSPVSRSPTRTDELPPVMACASGAWIWFMSHCSPESESLVGAAVVTVVASPCAESRLPSSSLDANLVVRRALDLRVLHQAVA